MSSSEGNGTTLVAVLQTLADRVAWRSEQDRDEWLDDVAETAGGLVDAVADHEDRLTRLDSDRAVPTEDQSDEHEDQDHAPEPAAPTKAAKKATARTR